ncbi:lipopolysaccharide N-acetylglucosaminyltransferase [Salipaludibacillus neizhouensis]|uniref:Lipopolysaccharide N-acetylglucosaminyltransferase n=1 Tax=Salipaludibacillus neizhouensis TaxID=885475 RepID=A0A3A9K489_9BACI|nr:glycosyltransferase family 4 protein [Salipaludibacillus neizhouensis]RKL65690.1 lipopolysaccharide N-acetylglucosaminyltransferase [Salipaludibacillus neizhouensis]
MRVLIICTEKLPVPPVKGGAIQTYIAGAVPYLNENHAITILGRDDPSLPDEEIIDDVQYVRVPGKLLETYREGIVNFVKDNTFDLIHIFNRPRLVCPVRDVAPNSRIILSMHNDMFKIEKIDPAEATKAISQLDKIITISNYIGEAIVKLFPEAKPKLQTIYSGVDLDRFVPIYSDKGRKLGDWIRKEYELESKKIILFAGRLSANKGADVLIRAVHKLTKKHSNVALVLMGSKGYSDNRMTDYIAYINAMANRFSIPVITTGFVQPDQIQNWFAAADIFVCPSQWEEPLARVHYEAMAAGLPIVTTARGGNTEVIEGNKNGLIVENPDNPEEFVTHLSTLLTNPKLCKQMGQHGRNFVERNHSWDRVVSDIANVWKEIDYNIQNNTTIGSVTLQGKKQLMENIQDTEQKEANADQEIQGEKRDKNINTRLSVIEEQQSPITQKTQLRKKKKLPYSPFNRSRSKNLGLVSILF